MEPKDLKEQLEGLFSGLVDPADSQQQAKSAQTQSQLHQEDPTLVNHEQGQRESVSPPPITAPIIELSTKPVERRQICPYLGLVDDRVSHLSYPETTHRCFVVDQILSIPLDHQSSFCFAANYQTCSRFIEPQPARQAVQPLPLAKPGATIRAAKGFSPGNLKWGLAGLAISLVMVAVLFYFFRGSSSPTSVATQEIVVQLAPTLTATPSPTHTVNPVTSTPVSVALLPTPIPTDTPAPGGKILALFPEEAYIGWLGSSEDSGNHFGDSFLYAGVFEGQIYQSAFQFDLSSVPRGAPIYSAAIHMTGLREDRLAIHNDRSNVGGTWSLRLLGPEIDEGWIGHSYQEIFNTSVLQTLQPVLSDKDLAVGQTNVFELSPTQVQILQTRITDNEEPLVSFRVEGPVVGPDNLFAWDTGYGPQSQGNRVTLFLNIGPEPATPPPYKYVVVTSTPTPENVVTAAAIARQMTAEATRIGTATPVSPNMVTATPIPADLVIIPTLRPENAATAQAQAELATAIAFTTGTPTPIPTNAVTATPTPTPSPTLLPVGSDPLIPFVLVTSTPTPPTIFAAATISVQQTAQAQRIGTPTPIPTNWVTPIVVTASPTPVNAATAQALAELATVVAFTTGTPTPTPRNIITATPTPVYENVPYLLTPPAPPSTPTPLPSIPASLLGKILFRSDRGGDSSRQSLSPAEYEQRTGQTAPEPGTRVFLTDPQTGQVAEFVITPPTDVYVYDPNTGELGRLTNGWPYDIAKKRDAYSADLVYWTYTKKQLWTNIEVSLGVDSDGRERIQRIPTDVLSVHFYDFKYKQEGIVTRMGAGIAYDPVWSPISNQIAFVATESGNDEIWVINYEGTDPRQLTRNTWEWDKSPSWSPDGKQIVFMSNRTGNQQIWIMNADGSDQRLLLGWDKWTPYNDYDPVWVKFLNPPPPPDLPR